MNADRHSPAGIARDLKRGDALFLLMPAASTDDAALLLELERRTAATVTMKRVGDWLSIEAAKVKSPCLFPTPAEGEPHEDREG